MFLRQFEGDIDVASFTLVHTHVQSIVRLVFKGLWFKWLVCKAFLPLERIASSDHFQPCFPIGFTNIESYIVTLLSSKCRVKDIESILVKLS